MPGTVNWPDLPDVSTLSESDLLSLSQSGILKNVSVGEFYKHVLIQDATALRSLTPVNDRRVYLKYHTSSGDGGHGWFRGVTGAAAATYTHNGGTILVPSGGDGSAAWLREYSGAVNVRWFGATGDGTTDDTTAIQTAVNAGNHIYFPTGTYIVSVIDIDTDSYFEGNGYSTILKSKDLNTNNVIRGNSTANNIIIKNLKIDGNNGSATDGDGIRLFGTHTNVLIDGVWIDEPYQNGIWVGGGANANIRISNCLVTGTFLADGIIIHTGTHYTITNCVINNTVTNDANNNVSVFHSTGASGLGIISNIVSTGGVNGISVEGNSTETIISNCYVESAVNGISVKDASSTNITISNCIVKDNTSRGYSIVGGSFINITGGIVDGNVFGIYAGNISQLNITGVTTLNNTTNTASTGSALHCFTITDLNINDCMFTDGQTHIGYISGITNGNISNNMFKSSTSDAIRFLAGSNINVANNNFISCTDSIDEGTVTNLRIINNSGADQTATGTITLHAWGYTDIDSSGGAVTATLGSGQYIGQQKTIVMSDASTSSTVSVTNHATSDPEVFTFAAVDATLVLMWNGTEWFTIANSGVTT